MRAAERPAAMKYVLVTGGVVSGLGKGVTASSIGVLLKACGHRVTCIKIDPYLNTDAGTMSPNEHGEVFVLDDGGEVDLDLGNYERFLDLTLTRDNNITTGKIYKAVIERERRGEFLGKTVQVVPHVTDAIQDWIERVAQVPVDGRPGPPGVCVIELGGTVGDIESAPFVEALRQLQFRAGPGNFCCVHVSLVPVLGAVGEQKTKPTQHSVQVLRSLGLSPHLLACRSEKPLESAVAEKLAQFCHVPAAHVLSLHDVANIWHVPLVLQQQRAPEAICAILGLQGHDRMDLDEWRTRLAERWDGLEGEVKVAMVGKYTGLSDAYLSVTKALQHACLAANRRLALQFVDAAALEAPAKGKGKEAQAAAMQTLREADGILVPGGFSKADKRGIEGKVVAVNYARTARKPFLGICLGMQVAVIEFARNVLGLREADSVEFNAATPSPAVVFMPEGSTTEKGGTMRLGSRRTLLTTVDCVTARLYQAEQGLDERHRHRYEVNPALVARLEAAGLRFVGRDESRARMEVAELGPEHGHPFFIGAQFHPEFKSRPLKPAPLFLGFILASAGKLDSFMAGVSAPFSPVPKKKRGRLQRKPLAERKASRVQRELSLSPAPKRKRAHRQRKAAKRKRSTLG